MTAMLGAIPLYHKTEDKRIIEYLQRNLTTHSLHTGKNTVSAKEIMYAPEGPKYSQILPLCVIGLVLITVFAMWVKQPPTRFEIPTVAEAF